MPDPWVVWAPVNGGPELKPTQHYEPADRDAALKHAARVGGFVVPRPTIYKESPP